MNSKILIVGGSGFIGRAIQKYVIESKQEKDFIFTYYNNPKNISDRLKKKRLDLLNDIETTIAEKISSVIYLAGNSYPTLAYLNPQKDVKLNVICLLNLIEKLSETIGNNLNMVILSTQAVYHGLKGEIHEGTIHIPSTPYGLSKFMAEQYAKLYYSGGKINNLWIFRLMYAYGDGEKETRLIPRCAKAASSGSTVEIYNWSSYLNPLPSHFVAKVLIHTAYMMTKMHCRSYKVINLNYPDNISVGDVILFLKNISDFRYRIYNSPKDAQIKFWGNTNTLIKLLNSWKIELPNIWRDMEQYYLRLLEKFDEV